MWCFGKVNGKLAEVYFEEKRGKNEIYAHCFVDEKDYKTKREKCGLRKILKNLNSASKTANILIYRNLEKIRGV